ncbi:Disintegrin and metalloproteinase domain-containing protein 9 [Collichthys lucidus]|uniref:Disintegrin and metalloproteinase domain-containing protein 9 n=1 Tax=Collichthys lucidus TaxID=240159 RepID=A0A4V6ASU8_COLLU|nr:Disintegrin and metalloproteinase domain-containing protein 9 [Collichthys lucidus]
MVRKYILFAVFLLFDVSGGDSEDNFNGFALKLPKYSIVNPQAIHRWSRSINNHSKQKSEEDMITYALNIDNRKHFLYLQKNKDFLHPNFVQYLHDATGNHKSSYPKQHVHCYYHGEVEGYENSVVVLSTCSGLRGVILLENETYGLEPVPRSTTNEHLLYLLKDLQSDHVTCGVVGEAASTQKHEPFEPGQSLTSLLRRKRNLPQTSYVELVLVVDNLRYYKQLNIRIVLVGLEIFKDVNPFSVDGSAGDVLGRFVKWRKASLLPKIRHDIGQLIVGRPNPYDGGVLGMAFVGTVCSVATSGGINVLSDDSLAYVSTVVAHEMGHNMGMNHDDTRCKCDGGSCIMAATAGGSTTFSKCSGEDFEALIIRGGGVCLKNQPSPSDVIGTAQCGNGRMDEGEQCDCGTPEVQCTNVDLSTIPSGAHVSIQMVQGSTCINADFNLGTDVLDPAYVNPGSPCDKGKTCLDFKCVNASALLPDLDCDAQTTCNNRGVCNDQGHCHCDNGWAPPNCDKSGRGGSVDSGPAQIDYSLRNGLLIFFLLVVPLLVLVILVLLYIFRRDTLDPCLKRRRLKYGELDYWNTEPTIAPTEPTIAPAQPPAPRQGPGVPKPIPPKQPPN